MKSVIVDSRVLAVKKLPDSPGVYQFINREGKIIYVGKAKNLKKRVLSYFSKSTNSRKTEVLVKQIDRISHIVVDDEEDALLLENNLIKKYQPKYNILLKDDKSFPWICIKNEPFQRIFYTRRLIQDRSDYFGPYTSVYMAKTILEIVKQVFQIRDCNLNLTEKNILDRKFKKCLEYQIGNCKAPCENLYSQIDYQNDVLNAKAILKGTLTPVFQYLKAEMQRAADKYDFELANTYKSKIQLLDNYKSKSLVCSSTITNLDVFSIHEKGNSAFVCYFRIVDGSIVNSYLQEIKRKLDEQMEDILSFCIVEIRKIFNSDSNEILVPLSMDVALKNVKFTIPKIGEKRKLLDLCERNGKLFMLERVKNESAKTPVTKSQRLMARLRDDLHLKKEPYWIECFDNSNISGSFPVSSCVVFKDCIPLKSQYRHFNVKEVQGPNDFATMAEVVERRYTRQLLEGNQLPDLIVIDGGKGQLSAAYGILQKLDLAEKIPIIGIAKRLEEIYYPLDPVPLFLDKKSESLKVLQQLRDEAHRFGISFHRNKRSENFTSSVLETIPGIGVKTLEKLLIRFKSPEKVSMLSFEELSSVVGKDKSLKILAHFGRNV